MTVTNAKYYHRLLVNPHERVGTGRKTLPRSAFVGENKNQTQFKQQQAPVEHIIRHSIGAHSTMNRRLGGKQWVAEHMLVPITALTLRCTPPGNVHRDKSPQPSVL